MNYELQDKINTTKELLSELEMKGWQEIEHLQTQIANLAEGSVNDKLRQLFKNLLTSYYVFTGGVETLLSEPEHEIAKPDKHVAEVKTDLVIDEPVITEPIDDFVPENTYSIKDYEVSEPFEYFVDFDEPIGEPISDKDLYNN